MTGGASTVGRSVGRSEFHSGVKVSCDRRSQPCISNHEKPPKGSLSGASKEIIVCDDGRYCSNENKSSLLLPYP